MTDIGTFKEPKNNMVPLLLWKSRPSEFEVQRNYSLALLNQGQIGTNNFVVPGLSEPLF